MLSISRIAAGAFVTLAVAGCEPLPAPEASSGSDGAFASGPAAPQATAGVTAQGEVTMPAGLTGEERVIWNSLTPAAKKQAADYIAAGGTLTQFVAI
ncbi:MAG: hypothetical protein HUJ24_11595 [Rhodobacteraceae bacterium]|nr:hypothetical protein [Paracoccaceae bacterium]